MQRQAICQPINLTHIEKEKKTHNKTSIERALKDKKERVAFLSYINCKKKKNPTQNGFHAN